MSHILSFGGQMKKKNQSDPTPLSKYQVFKTSDVALIAPATKRFSSHHQRRILDKGHLSYQVNTASMESIGLIWSHCNRDIEIEILQRFPYFFLHFLESGISQYSGLDLAVVNTPGNAVILSPCHQLKIRHIEATAFSLTLPESILIDTLAEILGHTPDKDLVFHPQIDLKSPVGKSIKGLFDFLVNDLENDPSHMVNTPSFQNGFARNLANLLINGLSHNYSSQLEQSHPTTSLGRVHIIEKHIIDHMKEVLTLDILAEIACVSKRALQKDFKRYRRYSPMGLLLNKRMEAVYQDLLSPTKNTTVTSAVHKSGIKSMGRFSSRYKDYFGESPSDTLARGQKGTPGS